VVEDTGRLLWELGEMPTESKVEVPDVVVGLDARVGEMVQLLTAGRSSHMALLHGMGGIGKTTLARIVFNKLHGKDPTVPCCFVGLEPGTNKDGIVAVQRHILKKLGNGADVFSAEEGRKELAAQLGSKKVLLVVDNVWDDQLEQLLPRGIMEVLGEGSSVLVTSRDLRAVHSFKGAELVHAELLSEEEAVQLLCRHAYAGSSSPPAAEAEQVKRVVERCGGLPMALEVVGRHLGQSTNRQRVFGDMENSLSSAFRKDKALRRDGERTLFAALKLSWKELDAEEQEALLDIVWFLKGLPWEVVESHCGSGDLARLWRFGLVKQAPTEEMYRIEVHDTIVAFCRDSSKHGIGRPPCRAAGDDACDEVCHVHINMHTIWNAMQSLFAAPWWDSALCARAVLAGAAVTVGAGSVPLGTMEMMAFGLHLIQFRAVHSLLRHSCRLQPLRLFAQLLQALPCFLLCYMLLKHTIRLRVCLGEGWEGLLHNAPMGIVFCPVGTRGSGPALPPHIPQCLGSPPLASPPSSLQGASTNGDGG
jgi:hypothetical protein